MFNKKVENINGIEFKRIPISMIEKNHTDNPRQSVNEAREELKNSISTTNGRYLVLEVSQRNDSSNYSLIRGGNTRLEVSEELHREWDVAWGENPYTEVNCIIYPWIDDAEKSIMNATENMVRGNLCFAEEARAVSILSETYANNGIDPDDVSFNDWIKKLGMPMSTSDSVIRRYLQTNEHISPFMPKLMFEGRSNSVVVRHLLKMRGDIYKLIKERVHTDTLTKAEREEVPSSVKRTTDQISSEAFLSCDDVVLDKEKLNKCILEKIENITQKMSANERKVFDDTGQLDVDKFALRYKINGSEEFTDDNRRSAAILLLDAMNGNKSISSNKRTRALNKMNVSNDVSGFYKLASMLDPGGRSMLARIIKEA